MISTNDNAIDFNEIDKTERGSEVLQGEGL